MTAKLTEADFYDSANCERLSDLNFYLKTAQEYGKDGVLEIGCGTGRILIEIAKLGIPIDGVDPNKRRMEICQEKVSSLAPDIRQRVSLSVCTVQDYKTDKKYSLITMPFRMFQQIITPEDQEQVLNAARKLLTKDGVLVFDIFNPSIKMLASEKYKKEFGITHHITPSGLKFIRKDRIADRDYFKQLQFCEEIYEYDLDGKHEKIVSKYDTRYTFKNELDLLLKNTGYEVIKTWGNFDGQPFGVAPYPGDIITFAKAKQK